MENICVNSIINRKFFYVDYNIAEGLRKRKNLQGISVFLDVHF